MDKKQFRQNILLVANILFLMTILTISRSSISPSLPALSEPITASLSAILAIFVLIIFWLQRVEENRIRGEFITIVTHKFRTPLTGIKWAIETLQKDITFQQKEDLLKQIEIADDKLIEIVNILVGFSKSDEKMNEYAYEAVSIREILDVILVKYSELIRQKKIAFTIDNDKDIPLIIIDKVKMEFVINTLVDNAIRYTPVGGSVGISITRLDDDVVVKVSDSGIGLRHGDFGHIFKNFFRGKDAKIMDTEGMGVSLYVSNTIVDHHGGKLEVYSKGKNKGSVFTLNIPMKR